MKPLQHIQIKNTLDARYQFIQLKDKKVACTNGFAGLIMPQEEVFQADLSNSLPDECYFSFDDWKGSKFDKCSFTKVNGNIIETFDSKSKRLGFLPFLIKEEFTNQHGPYPQIEVVIPSEEDKLSENVDLFFNPELLNNIYLAMNKAPIKMQVCRKNNLLVTFSESNAKAILVPMLKF